MPKVQTASANNADNGLLWARWSAFWVQWCLKWCVLAELLAAGPRWLLAVPIR